MVVPGLTAKILSAVIAGVAGSGIVAGSVIATSNNRSFAENIDLKEQMKGPEISGNREVPTPSTEGTDSKVSDDVSETQDPETEKVSESPETLDSRESLEEKGIETKTQVTSPVPESSKNPEQNNGVSSPSRRVRQTKEQEKEPNIRDKWDWEVSKKEGVWLESVYWSGEGDLTAKNCILYRRNEVINVESELQNENFDITEGRTVANRNHGSCDEQTLWFSRRLENDEHKGVGFWVRGERSWVNKLLRINWNNLSSDGFVSKDSSSKTSEELDKKFCSVERNDGLLLEISCIKPTNQLLRR
ncbi:hypothetical protein MSUIS_00330 [Mycoplasma suis KI3806]|uniref:Uncharacterized protein n=1 Tax=Mycoplasma suis (strain KI_3806) TaxID=708248 RepID=F0V2Q4_MYCS3|nr:hypothetical protein [Mycoplasma suis]CBZ40126.1 hypothetical protein MSUIS_00330 [Mycoplasma suis KI3806]